LAGRKYAQRIFWCADSVFGGKEALKVWTSVSVTENVFKHIQLIRSPIDDVVLSGITLPQSYLESWLDSLNRAPKISLTLIGGMNTPISGSEYLKR